jgi:K+-sensing histidine kinase KdpD
MLYLIPVVLAASFGTRAGVGAAVVAFLLTDLLFVEPRFTLAVADPRTGSIWASSCSSGW